MSSQQFVDPLRNWQELTRFISVRQRDKLQGLALWAETVRFGTIMLQRLYFDLYRENLLSSYASRGEHFEEPSDGDVRRELEFTANKFELNPQPKLTLFLEGESERVAVINASRGYFGLEPGKAGVELVVLGSVDNATGSKKEDRFRAILRLIDYLHHHQTMTFLVLDNENYARRLKDAAREAKSIHHAKRFVTRPEYIKIWKKSFEFDNFSNSELAQTLTEISEGRTNFSAPDINACRIAKFPGAELSRLFQERLSYGLNKIRLSELLVSHMLPPESRKDARNRPIIGVLRRVYRMAALNPLPTMQRVWEQNQTSKHLGKKRA